MTSSHQPGLCHPVLLPTAMPGTTQTQCSTCCSAEHHPEQGAPLMQAQGLTSAPAARCSLFLEFHSRVAVGSLLWSNLLVGGDSVSRQQCPAVSNPSGTSYSQPGVVLPGLLVLVMKLFLKTSVKNRKHLPPCLFAFVGSDLLLVVCNTKASLVV